jgi:hypothetical protein
MRSLGGPNIPKNGMPMGGGIDPNIRQRPTLEGKTNARYAGKDIPSNAPKDARVVPKILTTSEPRGLAAQKLLEKG